MDGITLMACLWQWLLIALQWHYCVDKTFTFICTWLCNKESYFLSHDYNICTVVWSPLHLSSSIYHHFLFFLRSELSGQCPSSNSSPTAEEEWCVQVRNDIMNCTQLQTIAQEYAKWMCGNSYILHYVNNKFRSEYLFLKIYQRKVTFKVLNLTSLNVISKDPGGNFKVIRLSSK